MKADYLNGLFFGLLLCLRRMANSRQGQAMWLCLCDCGRICTVAAYSLKSGHTKSCGQCRPRRGKTTHGLSRTRAYVAWRHMMDRCYDQNDKNYKDYGARGIAVCERWHTFENFFADMGDCPPGLTLERDDNNGNYEPGNCYWATRKEQCRNRRTSRRMWFEGALVTVAEVSEKTGILASTIIYRLNRGIPDNEATKPSRKDKKK